MFDVEKRFVVASVRQTFNAGLKCYSVFKHLGSQHIFKNQNTSKCMYRNNNILVKLT